MTGGTRLPRPLARAVLVTGAAVAARLAVRAARRATERDGRPTDRWARANYRQRTVNLAGGPAVAVTATLAAAAGAPGAAGAVAALVAGGGAGAVGLYDDLVGQRPEQRAKGLQGHLSALGQGRVTSGVVKIVGAAAAGAAATAATDLPRMPAAIGAGRRATVLAGVVLGSGVVAGSANLLNLLDLRPGRALKVVVFAGAGLAGGPAGGIAAAAAAAAAGAIPDDLAEHTMLGDCGANALGALLGLALTHRASPVGRAVALAVVGALTLTSERVSFSRVISRTPVLRDLDALGRGGEPPPESPVSGLPDPPRAD